MSALPSTEKPGRPGPAGPTLHPAFFIASWICFSNLTILFNKYLLDSAGFKYPVILTCWHLVFATAATQVLARTTSLLDSRNNITMTKSIYLRAFVPIGVFYSGSLVCSNLVYLYLSVPFIQMLKAGAPVAVLFCSWIWGLKEPSARAFLNILAIVLGVVLASLGEIEFNWIGFMFQLGGIVFEAMRIVMVEVLLKGEGDLKKMDPLVSLYYYAPVCAAMNIFVALFTELPTFDPADIWTTGAGTLLANASVAFMLNVASVFLIGKTSGLVLTLCGILKNVLLIGAAIMIWHDSISGLQLFGYAIALVGLVVYSESVKWEHVAGMAAWARSMWDSPEASQLPPLVRRFIVMAVGLLLLGMLVLGFNWEGETVTVPVGSA